jgi:CelD/BcsL family acetyltransferase involved in cellulose biosynthesis
VLLAQVVKRQAVAPTDLPVSLKGLRIALRAAFPSSETLLVTKTQARTIFFTDFLGQADAWNNLWQHSDAPSPSARAELVAQWVEHFTPDARFQAITVQQDGKLVAALPLVGQRIRRFLTAGALPQNEWSSGGDLLLDPRCDVPLVLDTLADEVARMPWPLLWLDNVAFQEPRWQAFQAALDRCGMTTSLEPKDQVGKVEPAADWAAFEARLGGDFRRSRRRNVKRLLQAGPTELRIVRPESLDNIDALVHDGFAVEDRSWKGAAGTSVLKNAGMLEFFQRQARFLAQATHLELVYLVHLEKPIAFAYVWRAKGVRFVAKLGYDEEFRALGPGQTLIYLLMQRGYAESDCPLVDFWGSLQPWSAEWSTRTYPVGRLVIAPPRFASRSLFYLYKKLGKRPVEAIPAASAA